MPNFQIQNVNYLNRIVYDKFENILYCRCHLILLDNTLPMADNKTSIFFYKVLEANETSGRYQYKEGLNRIADIQGVDATRTAFYFVDIDNIIKYINGTKSVLREITLPANIIPVQKNGIYYATEIIVGKKYNLSDIATFQILSDRGARIIPYVNEILEWSVCNCYGDVYDLVVTLGAHLGSLYSITPVMAMNGNLKSIAFLDRKGFNIHANEEEIFRMACAFEHITIVEYCLQRGIHIGQQLYRDLVCFTHRAIILRLIKYGIHGEIWNDSLRLALRTKNIGSAYIYIVFAGADVTIVTDNDTLDKIVAYGKTLQNLTIG